MNDRAALLAGSESGDVVDLDDPLSSRLLEVITTDSEFERMPPEGERLSPKEVEIITAWVKAGVPWEEGFAFQKPAYEPPLRPRSVELPPATPGLQHPVDRLVGAYFDENGLAWPEMVDDGEFLRRAHLDLVGLLPTIDEYHAFVNDDRTDKRERLIESLLARDVDYAEHWLTFWNDLLRNDYDGTGFITGGRKQISEWLYDALVTNKPFDQMTRELIAPPTSESVGFIDGIKWRGEVSAGQTVEIQFAQSVGQSFLGINLKCASCHDSFIDRWKLDEAYSLAAIYSERPLEIHRCDKPVGKTATAGWLFPELGNVDATAAKPERLQQLAALMTHPENGRFTRTLVNRLWHRLLGHGIVHPLDAMQTPPWSDDLLDYLAEDFRQNGYDLRKTLRLIATSRIYATRAQVVDSDQTSPDKFVFVGPRAKRMTAEQFVDTVWQITGAAPSRFDAPVFRGLPKDDAGDAIELQANWIWGDSAAEGQSPPGGERIVLVKSIDIDSPVKSGVAVVTCDNEFELFINGRSVLAGNNWEQVQSVSLHDKLKQGSNQIAIVAFNGATAPNPAGLFFEAHLETQKGQSISVVSDDSWRWAPRANEAKEGRLGGLPKNMSPAVVVKTLPVWANTVEPQAKSLLSMGGEASLRMVRASLLKSDFLMRSLGRPNRDQIVSMRPNELTTLEAIDLANGEELASLLRTGAERWMQEFQQRSPKPWHIEMAERLFVFALSRSPTKAELKSIESIVGTEPTESAIEDIMWAVLMLPEFQLVR